MLNIIYVIQACIYFFDDGDLNVDKFLFFNAVQF